MCDHWFHGYYNHHAHEISVKKQMHHTSTEWVYYNYLIKLFALNREL